MIFFFFVTIIFKPGKHEAKKLVGHAHMHKTKGETSAAGSGGHAFHGHHEKKHGHHEKHHHKF